MCPHRRYFVSMELCDDEGEGSGEADIAAPPSSAPAVCAAARAPSKVHKSKGAPAQVASRRLRRVAERPKLMSDRDIGGVGCISL